MPIRFQVDPDFYDHPKSIDLSDSAVALWTRAGSYSAGKLTDGFIADIVLAKLSATPTTSARELTKANLWHRVRGGYRFHQWEHRNLTRERVEAERKADRERKKGTPRGVRGNSNGTVTPQVTGSDDMLTDVEEGSTAPGGPNETESKPNRATIEAISGNVAESGGNPNGAGQHILVPTGIRPESDRNPDGSVSVSVSVSESLSSSYVSNASPENEPRSKPVSVGAMKLSRLYCDRVQLSDRSKVCMIITNATAAGYGDDQIGPALERLASERRPVTPDTLRLEIEGRPGSLVTVNGITHAPDGRPVAGPGWSEA